MITFLLIDTFNFGSPILQINSVIGLKVSSPIIQHKYVFKSKIDIKVKSSLFFYF